MSFPMMRAWRWLVGLVVLWVGSGAWAEPPPTNSEQGTRLHGTGELEHLNIPLANVLLPLTQGAAPATTSRGLRGAGGPGQFVLAINCVRSLSLEAGTLGIVRRCAQFVFPDIKQGVPPEKVVEGLTLLAPLEGEVVQLVIREVRAHTRRIPSTGAAASAAAPAWEYRVDWERKQGACATASNGDKNKDCVPLCPGRGYALAVPHAWSMSGELLQNPGYFTFACVPEVSDDGTMLPGGGVIAKCIDWGFPPWGTVRELKKALQLHQACVRMATADYCGEGRANTIDGTPLSFYDLRTVSSTRGDAPKMQLGGRLDSLQLEAAWALDGDCGRTRPLCLGKKRWSNLPLDAACMDREAVERMAMAGNASEGPIPCEGRTFGQLIQEGAVFLSYSLPIDAVLVRFGGPDGGPMLTTTAVELKPGPFNSLRPQYQAVLDGLNGLYSSQLEVEGPIFSKHLSEKLRSSRLFSPLFRCKDKQGRFVLANAQCPTGYTLDGDKEAALEGYVFRNVDPESKTQDRLLQVWEHATNKGTFAVSTECPEGYEATKPKPLGYLPAVGMLPSRVRVVSRTYH